MPSVPIHLPSATPSRAENPLPQLLHTPSGLALIEIQGTIHFPTPTESSGPSTQVGKLVFPYYNPNINDPSDTKWMKRVYMYIGKGQRMTGECKKLPKPYGVMRKKEKTDVEDVAMGGLEQEDGAKEEELEIVEVVSDYYSQCQPGAAPAPTAEPQPDPVPEPTPTTFTTVSPGAPTVSSTPSGSGPGKTLQSGYYWIRAVAAPNFHKYFQTKPLYSTGSALLGDYTTAGQFQVVDGQLVELVSAPGEPVKLLYAVVSEERSINGMSLAVSFSESKNTYGTFAWGGDDLQWSVSGVNRPNKSAWYVCTGQKLYINLGNYLYQTPSGCADQTVHYYNDKTANN
ncbi:unnamed protein product [Alternaria alternata]